VNIIDEFQVVSGKTTLAELQRWLAGVNAPSSSLIQVWGDIAEDGGGDIWIGEPE
jgi:hypothetical protein